MKILVSVVGQSNEVGSAPAGYLDRTGGVGAPLVDPIKPNGSLGSMWPRLSSLMGKRGHWLNVYNSAVGGTSLADNWVGRCRSYVVSMLVVNGSYVLDSGTLYKAVGTVGAVYTLNVAPSAGIGTSGLTSWTNLGAAGAGDTDGAVYAEGSARFDPSGYFAGILAGTQNTPGYDEKHIIVSIGQTDKTLSTSATQYAAAIVATSNYFTSRGYVVWVGFTCYGATAGLDAWYTSDLLPGRMSALATLGNTVNVGANLREALGVLAVSPASGIGLQADSLHMNAAAYSLAADMWDATFMVGGY